MPSNPTKEKNRLANSRKESARTAFAIFLSTLATLIAEPYIFTIRGDCELGLCLTSMLSVAEYAALLIAGGFVRVKKDSNSTNRLTVESLDVWNNFLEDLEIRDVAEATKIKVKVAAFKHRNAVTKIGDHRMELQVLRVGRCEEGESRTGKNAHDARPSTPLLN